MGRSGSTDSTHSTYSTWHYDHTAVLILALDTTTRAGSVAVSDDDRTLALVLGDPSRTHGERLPGEMQQALGQAGLTPRDLDLLVVASGPGAFTGLRIGLSAIQGLAMAAGIPVVGVSALDALALAASPPSGQDLETLVVWMDAQRGEVFAGQYEAGGEPPGWRAVGDATVGLPDDRLAALSGASSRRIAFTGDGGHKYREVIRAWSSDATILEPPDAITPALTILGRRLASEGYAGPPHALQPLYVRRPDAELERLRRSAS